MASGLITEPGSKLSIVALFLNIDTSVTFFLLDGLKEGKFVIASISAEAVSIIKTDPDDAPLLFTALFSSS